MRFARGAGGKFRLLKAARAVLNVARRSAVVPSFFSSLVSSLLSSLVLFHSYRSTFEAISSTLLVNQLKQQQKKFGHFSPVTSIQYIKFVLAQNLGRSCLRNSLTEVGLSVVSSRHIHPNMPLPFFSVLFWGW